MSDHTGVDEEGQGAASSRPGLSLSGTTGAVSPLRASTSSAGAKCSDVLVHGPVWENDIFAADMSLCHVSIMSSGSVAASSNIDWDQAKILGEWLVTHAARRSAPPVSSASEAPDQISALKAEIERLQIIVRDREWKRDLAEQEVDQLTTALAESERKRVEAESRAAVLSSALTMLGSHVVDPVVRKAIGDILARATPTQETPHVES